MQKRANRVTRKDVAAAAGVSTAVVSYVINNGPRPVAQATRARVEAEIKRLGYRPNAVARAMKRGTTATVGIIVPDVVEPFHSWVVRELDQCFRAAGFSLLLANVHESLAAEWKAINEFVTRGVDFLVVLMSAISDAQWESAKIPVPVAMLDRQRPLSGILTVGPDFFAGGKEITTHLLSHQRKRIVPVFGEFARQEDNSRYAGYLQAMREAGLAPCTPIICPWNMEGGYQAGKEYLRRGGAKFADGVFCFSDSIALGFYRALRENRVQIAQDVAVVGFDGIGLANYAAPALTTVAQPVQEMVEYLVRELVERRKFSDALAEQAPAVSFQKFPVQLKIAASCGCAES